MQRLANEVHKIMARPDIKAEFEAQGLEPKTSDPAAFKQQIDRELTRWSKDVKTLGIVSH
ncbi:Tripartite tricarboxylate transporter family receptor [compost metagenome]